MFTKEFSGDRKHLLADAPCQVSSFFAVGTDVASLLDMAREVAHLVQPGIEKLGRRGRNSFCSKAPKKSIYFNVVSHR